MLNQYLVGFYNATIHHYGIGSRSGLLASLQRGPAGLRRPAQMFATSAGDGGSPQGTFKNGQPFKELGPVDGMKYGLYRYYS